MKDFADALMETILEQEIPKIDNIMKDVTKNIAEDFWRKTVRLLDCYYDNYTPINYVRLYQPKRKLQSKRTKRNSKGYTIRKPKKGGVSLHSAIERMGDNDAALISEGSYEEGYTGGIIFDSAYFARMRHPGSGISSWDIVHNFLFSESEYTGNHPLMRRTLVDDGMAGEADAIFDDYLRNYDAKIDMFYKNACKKYR